MKWSIVIPVLALASLPFLAATPVRQEPGSANHCVELGGASIWGGVGWNHFVYITNYRCAQTLACTVSTDVDPDLLLATVPPDMTVQVTTAWNSPARWFVPIVSCELAVPREAPQYTPASPHVTRSIELASAIGEQSGTQASPLAPPIWQVEPAGH